MIPLEQTQAPPTASDLGVETVNQDGRPPESESGAAAAIFRRGCLAANPLADLHETATDRKIEQTIVYMQEHLDQPLQASALAAQANVSLSHYFALFKRRTGRTPIDFFIHLRMRRACQLLDTTSLTVKEVAAALGYDDPFYFSRVFKSINAVAPTDYRLARQGVSRSPGPCAAVSGQPRPWVPQHSLDTRPPPLALASAS